MDIEERGTADRRGRHAAGGDASSSESIYRHMVRGSVWMLLMRWGIRGIGLVSTMILARLLAPEDFGIVAIGALLIGILAVFSEMGTDLLVIRDTDTTREHFDTAWTISILQAVLVALLLVATAPYAAIYFDEPRATHVIYWMALSVAIGGFNNIGIALLRKELQFDKDFRFGIYVRFLKFALTIPFAFALRNYWAIVVGHIAGNVLSVVISYRMHAYRPRFSLARWRYFLDFSVSVIGLRVARYFNERLDVLVVGGLTDTARLGTYNLASELSKMTTREVVAPLSRALFPSYARLVGEAEELRTAFLHSLSAVVLIIFPLGVGLSAVAGDFVHVVLGARWSSAAPIIEWIAIYAALAGLLQTLGGQILIVIGRERVSMVLGWLRLAILAAFVVSAGAHLGVPAIPAAATAAAATALPLYLAVSTRTLAIPVSRVLVVLWRPAIATAVMWLAVRATGLAGLHPVPGLLAGTAAGVIVYTGVLGALWLAAGRPQGPERVLVDLARSRLARRRRTAP